MIGLLRNGENFSCMLLLLNIVVLRALWKIDVHFISTLVNKNLYYNSTDVSLLRGLNIPI